MPRVAPADFPWPNGLFVVGWFGSDAVCCGGLKRHSADACEIKRMYVLPERRGHGFGLALIGRLERPGWSLGRRVALLGTGERHAAARRMYKHAGYVFVESFSSNPFHAWSRAKRLDA